MDRSQVVRSTIGEEILETDDLYYRAGGIASWTQYATYIIQPSCPRITSVNQVRQINLPKETDPEEFLAEAQEFFREVEIPNLEIRIDQRTFPQDLADHLSEAGYHEETEYIYCTRTPAPVVQKSVNVLPAKEIGVLEDLEAVRAKWDRASLNEEACLQAAEVRQFRREAGVMEEFVGYFEGEPACTFSTLRIAGTGRLKDFLMDPDYLGDDIEKAVMGAGLNYLFQRGLKLVGVSGSDLSGMDYLLEPFRFTKVGRTGIYRLRL